MESGKLKPVCTTPNLVKFCKQVWILPTTFEECLTYEEQMCYIVRFIRDNIIPTINENALATKELQDKVAELKLYVDNYFESLNVQDEINAKLDAMAQSGELTDIIAKYLQLQGVLAFNTIAELKNAENIVNGSFTRTFGKNSYNDGLGSYYKIRTRLQSDKVDEEAILSVKNPLLVAEKINNLNFTKYYVEKSGEISGKNTLHEQIKYEEEIQELPVSNHQLAEEAIKTTEANIAKDTIITSTFNIRNEEVPYSDGLNGLKKYSTLRRLFSKIKSNLTGLQENHRSVIYPVSMLTNEFVKYANFGETLHEFVPLFDYGNLTLASFKPTEQTSALFSRDDGEKRGYVKTVIDVNGKKVSHYNTHLAFRDETIKLELQELANIIAGDINPYKIICGDFNYDLTRNEEFLKPFNKTVTAVNNGQYKSFNNKTALDEILVTNNISIVKSEMIDVVKDGLSDHNPVIAEIKLN